VNEASTPLHPPLATAPRRRPGVRFLLSHPAHFVALGFGCGLAPQAPGTVATLWSWAAFVVLDAWLSASQWGALLLVGFFVAWWASTVTARHLALPDPGFIVCDEILAFWLVLWLVMPAGWLAQFTAFVLFRYFDAAKPGPVGWADARFKRRRIGGLPVEPIGWRQGFGVLFDDGVAAFCTLFVIAVWQAM
jgi:phosphatidylglycerophosphatase A